MGKRYVITHELKDSDEPGCGSQVLGLVVLAGIIYWVVSVW